MLSKATADVLFNMSLWDASFTDATFLVDVCKAHTLVSGTACRLACWVRPQRRSCLIWAYVISCLHMPHSLFSVSHGAKRSPTLDPRTCAGFAHLAQFMWWGWCGIGLHCHYVVYQKTGAQLTPSSDFSYTFRGLVYRCHILGGRL